MTYDAIPSSKTMEATAEAVRQRGIAVTVVENAAEALEQVKTLIPKDSSVMNGSSTTLQQIGFVEYLKSGTHPWKNLHEPILAEQDQVKRMDLMRQALLADWYLASVNAIAETGELVSADASGSRVGAYPFAARHLLLIAGAQKIVPTLEGAMQRVREYAYPLEDERAKKAYGMSSIIGKMMIFEHERLPNRTTLILVREKLGF